LQLIPGAAQFNWATVLARVCDWIAVSNPAWGMNAFVLL